MLDNIAPGTKVTVKVTKDPTNDAAQKTLRRILSKDAAAKKENDRHAKVRKAGFSSHQRGGRPWEVRVPKQHARDGKTGETSTLLATADVLRDLKSVARFVEVSKA